MKQLSLALLLVLAAADAQSKNYTAHVAVVAHPVTVDSASLISAVNGTSAFWYNLNAAYFPLPSGPDNVTDGLVVRVCNCSWGHKGHTPPMTHCADTWPGAKKSVGGAHWGATAIATRKPGDAYGWEYN